MKKIFVLGLAFSITSLLMAGAAVAAGPAPTALVPPTPPASPTPDRTQLSTDENVTINAACFSARKQDATFKRCIETQLGQLKQNPSPDRSALSADRNQEVEYACADYRARGIGAYNKCLTQQIAAGDGI
jgi:hypothetical protein